MSVALCHEWLTTYGGSDQVAQRLAQALAIDDVFVFTSRSELRNELFPDHVVTEVAGILAGPASRNWKPFLPLMPQAWRRVDLSAYDLVITSSHAAVNSVRPPERTVVVSYCHTPMRYAWEWQMEIARIPALLRPLWPQIAKRLRKADRDRAQRVDLFIANSNFVAKRIARYYGKGSAVVHPPIDVSYWCPGSTPKRDHFLLLGRLVAYKRPELVVEAANRARARLIVAGSGPMLGKLKHIAGPTVSFEASPDRGRVRELYRSARAFVFAGIEDFGMTMAEAQACGTPVIALGAGGAMEIVDSETGLLVDDDDPHTFERALSSFDESRYDPLDISARAQRFDGAIFDTKIRELVALAEAADRDGLKSHPAWVES